jgi:hypothetical protein
MKQGEEMRRRLNSKEWIDSVENKKWMFKDSTSGKRIYKPSPKDTIIGG